MTRSHTQNSFVQQAHRRKEPAAGRSVADEERLIAYVVTYVIRQMVCLLWGLIEYASDGAIHTRRLPPHIFTQPSTQLQR